jgi:23S rRNA pseudouridine1911/1915/1917 synthase
MEYSVVCEDSDLLVVDKPQGLATAEGESPCLCRAVLADHPEIAGVSGHRKGEGGLLNRLDNETGGLVLFARTDAAFEYYSRLMKSEKVEKHYLAVAEGRLSPSEGLFEAGLAHHPKNKAKMVAVAGKQRFRSRIQKAVTRYRVVSGSGAWSIVSLTISKGVRHQIRVHLSHAGHPVAGDKLYGSRNGPSVPSHLLFAVGLSFTDRNGAPRQISIYDGVLEKIQAIVRDLEQDKTAG